VQASIQAAVDCPLCPEVTPEQGVEALAKSATNEPMGTVKVSEANQERVDALAADEAWRATALGWVIEFWAEHGHGPTWRAFKTAEFWPPEHRSQVRKAVMSALYWSGYLDGTRIPYGLRACVEPIARNRRPARRSADPAGT
jgi:hypothetical protein